MSVYAKHFRVPSRFRTSLSPDECEILEVDGVPFVDEYGAFPPVDELRVDHSGHYLLFSESGIDAFIGIDLISHHIIEPFSPELAVQSRGSAWWCGKDWVGWGWCARGPVRDSVF